MAKVCGIAGFTNFRSIPVDGRIQRAIHGLSHRGPDQQGVFESSAVSLGAARLKIIDLDGGDQPLVSPSGDTVAIFNGEIYNHLELRSELERRGHRFRSRADTETLLEAFLEWDTDCFSRLRGMFALAFWTQSSRRLVLARDRIGIKPLYIAHHRGDLYFGSEMKTIFVHPEIERRLSLAGLDCYLSLNYVPAPWTLVEGIEKLRPGHWLEWRNGRVRSEPYWTLPEPRPQARDVASAAEELDSLLRQSVREHLHADVPLGLWLSGGIDSSTLLHYATEVSGRPVKTFSISFRGRSFDESAAIARVARHYGSEHRQFDLNPGVDLESAVKEFAYYFDEPVADGGALPVWFLSRLTRQNVTVALSGEGSDELFGGYLTYRANDLARIARKFPALATRLARTAARLLPVSDEKIGFEYAVKRFLDGCLMPAAHAHVYWNGTFSAAQKRSLTTVPLPPALDAVLGDLAASGDSLPSYLRFDQKYYLPDDILAKLDRTGMAHSIETRPPFLDHRIVEFAATLPSHFKIHNSRQKIVLKELMRGKLPDSTLHRKKSGFDFPAHQWLRGPLRDVMLDALGD
ncbi:MAG: asparagine synthase (glutamine-hydrolyzing), partial [Bryobacteraceae bacterium]